MSIGISHQVEYDFNNGYFSSNDTVIKEVKSNIINWMNTNKGDRITMPDFGLDAKSLLFNPNPENVAQVCKERIRSGFARWFPFVKINSIESQVVDNRVKITLDLYFKSTEFTIEQILQVQA